MVAPADLGVVGSGVPRSPGDAGVPRDHLESLVESRGALRKEPHTCLRSGSAMRRREHVKANHIGAGKIKNVVMISERPAEVKDRAVPGHWEGDLIFGKKMTSIGTLVERHSRYVILLKLPNGHNAEAVRQAMTKRVLTLPRPTATLDHLGSRVRNRPTRPFRQSTAECRPLLNPKSPWRRGSNENTNGLLRQYLPRRLQISPKPPPARA